MIYIYILHNLKPYKEYGESWKLMLKINKLIDHDNLILKYNIKYWSPCYVLSFKKI